MIIDKTLKAPILQSTDNQLITIFMGSFPSFASTFGMGLCFASYADSWTLKVGLLSGVVVSAFTKELLSYDAEFRETGETLDYFDMVAIILAGVAVYYLLKKYSSYLNQKITYKKTKS